MKRLALNASFVFLALIFLVQTAGCGPAATSPQAVNISSTPTGDLCSPGNVKTEVEKLARVMHEFDDAAYLSSTTPREQLAQVILSLQATRRKAEDLAAPSCLQTLKEYQINFMNGLIVTLSSYLGGASQEKVQNQVTAIGNLRMLYDAEIAKQLGLKYETPTPRPTIPPTPVTPTVTPSPVTASPDVSIYVLKGPGYNYPIAGTFMVGTTANIIGRNHNGDWIQIQVMNATSDTGWVPIKDAKTGQIIVKITGDTTQVPLVEAPPLQP